MDINCLFKKATDEREEGLERERRGEKPLLSPYIKELVDKLTEDEKGDLLAMTMESLRGSWVFPEQRLALVFYLCDILTSIPPLLLDAIRHNAYLFNGNYIDGRIFRDGDRVHGLSGNFAFAVIGDDRIKQQEGFYGTYNEIWKIVRKEEIIIRKLVKILALIDDLTWNYDIAE